MRCIVIRGLFSALTSSLHDSIDPPEIKIYQSSEDGVWLPIWGNNNIYFFTYEQVILTVLILIPWNTLVSVQSHMPVDPPEISAGERCNKYPKVQCRRGEGGGGGYNGLI